MGINELILTIECFDIMESAKREMSTEQYEIMELIIIGHTCTHICKIKHIRKSKYYKTKTEIQNILREILKSK